MAMKNLKDDEKKEKKVVLPQTAFSPKAQEKIKAWSAPETKTTNTPAPKAETSKTTSKTGIKTTAPKTEKTVPKLVMPKDSFSSKMQEKIEGWDTAAEVKDGAKKTFVTKKAAVQKYNGAVAKMGEEEKKLELPEVPKWGAQRRKEDFQKTVNSAKVESYRKYLEEGKEEEKEDKKTGRDFLSEKTKELISSKVGDPDKAMENTLTRGEDLTWVQRRIDESGSRTWKEYLTTVTEEDAKEFENVDFNTLGILERSYVFDLREAARVNTAQKDAAEASRELGGVNIEENYYVNKLAKAREQELRSIKPEDYVYTPKVIDDEDEEFSEYLTGLYARAEAEALRRVYSDEELDAIEKNVLKKNGGYFSFLKDQALNGLRNDGIRIGELLGLDMKPLAEEAYEAEKEIEEKNRNVAGAYGVVDEARATNWREKTEQLREMPDWNEKSVLPENDGSESEKQLKLHLYNADKLAEMRKKGVVATAYNEDELRVIEFATEEEKQVIAYLWRSYDDEKERAEAIRGYVHSIKESALARRSAERAGEKERYAANHPVLANVGTVFGGIAEGVQGAVDAVADPVKVMVTGVDKPYDVNSTRFDYQRDREAIMQATKDNIDSKVGDFVYETTMSIADNVTRVGVASAVGGIVGGPVGASIAAKYLAPVLMSGSVYRSSLKNALDRGASNNTARAFASVATVTEFVTERIGMDNLVDNVMKGVKTGSVGAAMLNSSVSESLEEGAAWMAEIVYDDMLMGENSNYNKKVAQYMANGYTHKEANNYAMRDVAIEGASAVLSGLISGGVMAGGGAVIGNGTKSIKNHVTGGAETDNTSPAEIAIGEETRETLSDEMLSRLETVAEPLAGSEESEAVVSSMKKGTDIVIDRLSEGEWSEEHEGIFNKAVGDLEAIKARTEDESSRNEIQNEIDRVQKIRAEKMAELTPLTADAALKAKIPTATIMSADEAVRIADAELRVINAAEPDGKKALSNEKQDWTEKRKAAEQKLKDIKFVKGLADAGFHVKFFSAAEAEDGTKTSDGAAVGKDVYININGVDPVKKTLGHEFVHVLKNTSAEAYADFAKVVREQFDTRFAREVEADIEMRYEGAYESFDEEARFEEFAADVAGDMLINPEYSQSLIDAIMQSEDAVEVKKSKIKAIAEAVRSVIIKLTTAVRKMRGTYEAGKALQYITDAKAVHQALVKAYHEVGNKKTASGADVKWSANKVYNHVYDESKVSREFFNSVNKEIEQAIINIRNGNFEAVPEVIEVVDLDENAIKTISDFLGYDISGYAVKIERDRLLHIEKRHGISGEHDHSLSDPKDTARMGYVLNHGDNIDWAVDDKGEDIYDSKYNDKNNKIARVFVVQTRVDGTYTVSQVAPDSKRKTLWITSARIEKANVGSQVPNGSSTTPQLTPEAPLVSSSAFNNNVSQTEADVKGDNLSGGEVKFSFAGPRAETADMSAFERAKNMEQGNATAEEILRETGWYRGVDGKWRFEISDEDAEFSRRGDLEYKKEHPDYARYRELLEIQESGGRALTASEAAEHNDLRKIWKDVFKENGKAGAGAAVQGRLAAYFQHDKLYEAYPELRDVEIEFDENTDRSSFSLKTKTITLAEKANVDEYKKSLIHEIQHWIQDKEGFTNGSSEEYWKDRNNIKFREERKRISELDAELKELYRRVKPLYEAINYRAYSEMLFDKEERGEITIEDYARLTDEYVREKSPELYALRQKIVQLNKEYSRLTLSTRSADDLYYNTAGEIEARDASARTGMTGAERRGNMPARGDDNTVFADYSEYGLDKVEDNKKTAEEAVDGGAVPYTEHEKKNWKKSNTIVVYENEEQLNKFVLDALNNQNANKKMYFGKVPTDVSKMVLDKTGVDINGYNIALKGYEVKKILLYSHGNEVKEAERGQEAITIDDLKKIPLVIASPDNVTLSNKLYEGKPLLYFEKLIDGKIFVATYVSRKHHDISVQTMYKRKRSLATANDAKSPLFTSETTSSTASFIDTVSQGEADVKRDNVSREVKFSMPTPKSQAQYEDRAYKLKKEIMACVSERLGKVVSSESEGAIEGLAESMARSDESQAKSWREKLCDFILKNDMVFEEIEHTDAVLEEYFKSMRRNKNKVLVEKEDSQDLTTRELSSIFGVGGWSRTEGLGVDVMYEELASMGAQLAEADSVQDRLIAIKEAKEKSRRVERVPMLNSGNVVELIADAERSAVNAISEVERAREEMLQNNPSVSEADSSLYTRGPVSNANVTATVAHLNEMYDAIENATDDVQKVTLEDEYRAEQLRFFEWILPHFTKANERGVTGDYCFHTNSELDAERAEVAESQRAAREADDYMNEQQMSRDMVMAAHLLGEGETTEEELGRRYRMPEDREKIRTLAEMYKKVTASPDKLRRRHKKLFDDVIKHLFYYSNLMRDISQVNIQFDTPERNIDKITRINQLRDAGKHGVTGDRTDDYFILLSDKLKDILIRGKDANEARLKKAATRYRQIVKDLDIKAGGEDSALIQDYGEGRITELDIPFDKRKIVIDAAKVLTEEVYRPLLEEANRRRFIEGKGEFVAPPLKLTESERRSFRYMLDNAHWVREHMAQVKDKIKAVGVQEAAKSFNLNEGVVQAVSDHGDQFARFVKWGESKWIAEDRAPILQQAWNLVQRGKKYNPRSGKVEMDYFPHFEKDDAITELGNLFIDQLPTAINGLTESFRPNSKYNPYFNARTGNKTDSDAIFGADAYINAALQYIYHTSDITKARMAENHIREKYSKDSKNPYVLSNFVFWLREWANQMAGKQHSVDRMMQNLIGRRASKVWRKGMGNIGRNQISWNLRTPFSNFSVWTRGLAVVAQELASNGGSSGLSYAFGGWNEHINKSDFLYSRFYENIDLSAKDASKPVLGNGFKAGAINAATNVINTVSNAGKKVSDAGFKLMGWSDKFTITAMHKMLTGVYIAQGMSEEDAIRKADYEMKSQAASRDFGDAPLIFSSQALRPLTMFQVEALNQLAYSKDVIAKVVKNPKTARYIAATVLGLALEALFISLFNDLIKKLTGSPVMLDAVGITLDSVESMKNGAGIDEVALDVAEEIPIVNNVLKATKGEMSEMIGIGAVVSVVNNIVAAASPNAEVNWGELLYNAGLLVNPFGGMAQAKKTYQALQLIGESYSENSKGQVRYAVDGDMRDVIFGVLFGKSSMPAVQEWWDSEYKSLNKNNSNAFKQVLDLYEIKPEEAFDMMMEFQDMCSEAKKADSSYSSYSSHEWVTQELDKWNDGKWSTYDKYFISCLIDGREATIPQRMEWPEKIIAEMFIRTGDNAYLMQTALDTFDVTGAGVKTVCTMDETQQEKYQEKYQEVLFREISSWEAGKGFDGIWNEEQWKDNINKSKSIAREQAAAYCAENGYYESKHDEAIPPETDTFESLKNNDKLTDEERFESYLKKEAKDHIVYDERYAEGWNVMRDTFLAEGNTAVLPSEKNRSFSNNKKLYTLNDEQYARFVEYYNEAFYERLAGMKNYTYEQIVGGMAKLKTAATNEAKGRIMDEYEGEILVTDKK